MEVYFNQKQLPIVGKNYSIEELQCNLCDLLGLTEEQFYLISNGRKVNTNMLSGRVHVVLRLLGGKGGFGSMLRAIGAQIEKTTNREACRDLSGRRLRDINEEQRLKKWVEQQADREKEVQERKKKKLERLLEQPKLEFKDDEYDKARAALPEKVEDAVLKGLEASCSTAKRKADANEKSKIPKKKAKLWIDMELEEDISDTDTEDDDKSVEETSPKPPEQLDDRREDKSNQTSSETK